MNPKIVEWQTKSLPAFSRDWVDFVTVDPDNNGALVWHYKDEPKSGCTLDDIGAAASFVQVHHTGGPLVMLIEFPYVGTNAYSAIGSGVRVGSIPAMVAALGRCRVEVVWLHTGTWQAHLKRVGDLKGTIDPATGKRGKVEREALKAEAVRLLPETVAAFPAYRAGRKEQKQAFADACAMGRWWREERPSP